MSIDPGKMTPIKLWVQPPLGKKYRVETITGDIAHYGNAVAEGRMHRSMLWPTLARGFLGQATRSNERFVKASRTVDAIRRLLAQEEYAAGWCARWMEDSERGGE
jgi:hypothetical protein